MSARLSPCSRLQAARCAVTPVSDHGPFRVSLLGVEYRRQLTYERPGFSLGRVPPPPRPAPRDPGQKNAETRIRPAPHIVAQFSADLLVAAEPRLALSQRGAVQVVEASDELGNSLVPHGDDGQAASRDGSSFFGASGPTLRLPIPLERPLVAGQIIKKLRGTVPATVSSRRADPLVVPLTDSAGKTFENSELRVTVHDVKVVPNTGNNTVIELSVRQNDADTTTEDAEPLGFHHAFQHFGQQHLQIEIVDTGGQLIPWFQPEFDAETSRVTLTLTSLPQNAKPKELRYYSLTRASTTIPFEFVDIPMP